MITSKRVQIEQSLREWTEIRHAQHEAKEAVQVAKRDGAGDVTLALLESEVVRLQTMDDAGMCALQKSFDELRPAAVQAPARLRQRALDLI
jgi:uncharacterized protein GlcG (DUF336 family)